MNNNVISTTDQKIAYLFKMAINFIEKVEMLVKIDKLINKNSTLSLDASKYLNI